MQLSLFEYYPENTPVSASTDPSNDYHMLPASEKQLRFAQALAKRTKEKLPAEVCADRRELSRWIDAHKSIIGKDAPKSASKFSNYASSKQVAFAERIARIKHRQVPPECFRDKGLMSKWIDGNR